ncbi:MAG: tRNA pseudouridine(55) synthase TruB [Vicinamibacteria bacterium]
MSLAGALVVDKPRGPTSHDVVARVRRALGMRRAGHTGTLDPFATGVLVVCLGRATRLARFLAEGDKLYEAEVRLGFATSTDDLEGEPLGPLRQPEISREAVLAACARLVGSHLQRPPAFSAKRVGGRRAYALARAGRPTQPDPVPVTVHALELLAFEGSRLEFRVRCSPGTYVRALARDLGEALGTGAHLGALRRTESGGFALEEALPLDQIETRGMESVVPLRRLLADWPCVLVGEPGREALRHGRDLGESQVAEGFPEEPPPPRLRVLGPDGELLALASPRGFGPAVAGLSRQPALHPDLVLLGAD